MKKFLSFLLAVSVAATAQIAVFAKTNGPTVKVDGRTIVFPESDQAPLIMENRTYVPIRRVLENMGAKVEWNAENRTVKVTSVDNVTEIILTIDQKEITKYTYTSVLHADKTTLESDVAPVIIGNRTMLPIRIVAENIGATVNWKADNALVEITTQQTKRASKKAGIENFDSEEFDVVESVKNNIPKLSLTTDADDANTGDVVTLKVKLADLEKVAEDTKVCSTTVSILFDENNFTYKDYKCLSADGEVTPALEAHNERFYEGCAKIITLSLPDAAYLPAEDGTVLEINFVANNDEGGEFAISDGISDIGYDTQIMITDGNAPENYRTIKNYNELFIDTTPVIVK